MTVRGNRSILFFVLAAALAGGVFLSPQERTGVRQQLKEEDISKFLSDFPVILDRIENVSGDASVLSGLDLRSVDYASIQGEPILVDLFSSYQWDELFFRKFRAIVHSFTIVERERAREDAARELQKAILEIEDEPTLSPEQIAADYRSVNQELVRIGIWGGFTFLLLIGIAIYMT